MALVALDLQQKGLFHASSLSKWRSYMTIGNLYSEHWLLAYEALQQGWLTPKHGTDYVASDDFFSILQGHNVHFYGAELASSSVGYDDDDGDVIRLLSESATDYKSEDDEGSEESES